MKDPLRLFAGNCRCYTRLTDVEQEQNGVYFYDRSRKFDTASWRAHFTRRPQGYDL